MEGAECHTSSSVNISLKKIKEKANWKGHRHKHIHGQSITSEENKKSFLIYFIQYIVRLLLPLSLKNAVEI